MSIYSEPTMPGYLWAPRPAGVDAWAPPPVPQPWTAAPPRPATPAPACAAAPPPAWPQPRPPARPRHRWLPVGMAASVVVLAAAAGLVVTLTANSSPKPTTDRPAAAPAPAAPTPPPPPPLVRDAALPVLLLDASTVNAVMGTGELAVNPELTTDRLYNDTTDQPDCGGVWANANKQAYAGSGWQAVQTQYLREPNRPQHEVYESVVSFPTAAAAKDFVAKEASRWPLCTNTAATTTNPTLPPQTWWVGAVHHDGDDLTSMATREGTAGYACQHALTARNNVVIDAVACGRDVMQQGSTIAGRIAEQIAKTL
jgi:hypothetical protein